jgi:DNA-binding transcriptional regulator PaaX
MRKESKEMIKLTAKEILLTLFDIPLAGLSLTDARGYYRKSLSEYFDERCLDRSNFWQKIGYLKKQGLVNSYLEGNERYLELTELGLELINKKNFTKIQNTRPQYWDGCFRLVMFDIPEDKKYLRDKLRRKLRIIGFKQVQKSIFAYPFECKKEIELICCHYGVRRYLKYMIAEIIEGEDEIISHFLDLGVMSLQDLDTRK